MGTNRTPDNFRGFLIPYGITPNNLWKNQSTYTQAGSRAGIPEPAQTGTGLILETTGKQNQSLEIKTVKGGSAGSGAGFVWKGAGVDLFGRDSVSSILGFQYWRFFPSAVAGSVKSVDAIGTQSGVLISTYENYIPTGTLHKIIVKRQAQSAPASSEIELFGEKLTGTEGHPTICELSDGSIIVCHFRLTSSNFITIGVHRSTDEGENWVEISSGALDTKIDSTAYTPQKMRMTANNNSILLVMELQSSSGSFRNRLGQYISYDRGASFQLIGISDPSGSLYFHRPDVFTFPDGSFGFVSIQDQNKVVFNRIPYGSFDLSSTSYSLDQIVITNTGSLPVSTTTGTELQNGRLCTWIDDDNVVYVAIGNVTDKSISMFASYDDGLTWVFMSGGTTTGSLTTARFFQPNTTGSVVSRLTACRFEGRCILMGINDISIPMFFLGGYSNFNLPATQNDPAFTDYIRFDSSWVPMELPAVSSTWTAAGAGAESLTSTGVSLTTNANQKYYVNVPTISTIQNGIICRYRLKLTTGGRAGANDIGVRLKLDDGSSNSFQAVIRYTTTSFLIVDEIAPATKHTQSITMTNDVEFIVAMTNGKMTFLYRPWSTNDARIFTRIDVTGLSNGGGGATNLIEWGHLTSPPANTESSWGEFHFSVDGSTGQQMIGTLTPVYRLYPIQGDFLYVNGGTSITTRDSPAYENDVYKINQRYDYSIDRTFFDMSPSRRVTWRSESVASGPISSQRIAFQLDPKLGNFESQLGSDLMAIHMAGINFREFKIRRYDVGTAAWVTVGTINTAAGLTSTFRRTGNTIEFDGAGADSFYLHYEEAKNWHVELGSGDAAVIRPVETNSEGTWNNNAAKRTTVKLTDIDNTEPASGSVKFIPDQVTVIVSLNGETGSAWAIEIDTQQTFEKYFEIGSLTFGSVAVIAPTYGRGRSITFETNTDVSRSLDGTTFVRKFSDGRRVASVSWTDGVDTSPVNDANPSPDYWQFSTTAGAVPSANYGDAPTMMTGLYRHLGQHTPVVYLPSWKKSTAPADDVVLLNRYHEQLFGITDGNVSIDHVIGSELSGDNRGEVFRISSITIRELE